MKTICDKNCTDHESIIESLKGANDELRSFMVHLADKEQENLKKIVKAYDDHGVPAIILYCQICSTVTDVRFTGKVSGVAKDHCPSCLSKYKSLA